MRQLMTLVGLMATTWTFAQSPIFTDRQTPEGRTIVTNPVLFASYKNKTTHHLSLAYNEQYVAGDTIRLYRLGLHITVGDRSHMDEGQRILIKFDNDSVMERFLAYPLHPPDFEMKKTYSVISYEATPFYTLYPEDIAYIINNEIIRIRIEAYWAAPGHFTWSKAPTSKVWCPTSAIKELYEAIRERLKISRTDSLYDDF